MRFRTRIAALALALSPLAVQAHSLSEVSGSVVVNNGAGFKPSGDGANLAVGSSVMARRGASAIIAYDDGCRVRIRPGGVVLVSKASPCKTRNQPIARTIEGIPNDYLAQVGGNPQVNAVTPPFFPTGALVVGGMVAVVGVTVGLNATTDNNTSP